MAAYHPGFVTSQTLSLQLLVLHLLFFPYVFGLECGPFGNERQILVNPENIICGRVSYACFLFCFEFYVLMEQTHLQLH